MSRRYDAHHAPINMKRPGKKVFFRASWIIISRYNMIAANAIMSRDRMKSSIFSPEAANYSAAYPDRS